ncbi:MAG: lysine--tRNA ligase [Clostridiaceae bacterium]|nr:lysine--tRNA ligase [Clostridiaceae bacterium]
MNNETETEELLEGSPEYSEVVRVRREKLTKLQSEGLDPFRETKFERTSDSSYILNNFEKLENETVSLAGRIMSKRDMGKASFSDLLDHTGRIQLYIKIDELGAENYERFKKYDIGDIVGVTGYVFRTRRGEISIHVKEVKLLCKSLLPLPEKWHGLKDTDARYRQRYVDLIVNPEVKDTFIRRTRIISAMRRFLDNRNYIEVETPVLQTVAGGAAARPFNTHHNALNVDMHLRISLELYLKRLIVGGLDRVYEIGRVFRNEGVDTRHNPEFTLLELYEAYTDINGMMEITESMIRTVAKEVLGTAEVPYGDQTIDLEKPFDKLTMTEALKKYAGIDFDKVESLEQAKALAKEHHIDVEERHGKGDILSMLFEEYCEDKLVQPTFIISHPIEISPLAKKDLENPGYTQRFELFITGREFANAFSELNDPIDQRERFENQLRLKAMGDDEASEMDEDFLTALEYGMPPTGGMGMGIDRLVMLLTNSAAIRDVLLFPTMKPLD